MSLDSRTRIGAFAGLLISVCLFSDLGFGTAEQIVDTEPYVVLEVGTRGILPCRIRRRVYSVEWKGQLSSGTELLVSLDKFINVVNRDGPGYEAGLFNITEDYSLVIKDVKVQDEGLYICIVSDYKTGKFFQNITRVSVQALPDEPFPIIQECIGKDENFGACTLTVHSTSNLTCLVKGYYPDIDLFFLHGSEYMASTEYQEWNNTDGTKNKIIRIPISASDEPYQCVASRLPGTVGNRSVAVNVQARSKGPSVAAIVVPVLMVVGICLSIAVFFKYHRGNNRGWCSRHGSVPVPQETPLKDDIPTDVYVQEAKTLCDSQKNTNSQDAMIPPKLTTVSSPVENRRVSLSFKRSVLGRSGSQGLFRPHDVIYHKGKYFITDTGHHCVSSYNPVSEAHTIECQILLNKLFGLASLSDPNQGILVTNALGGRVYRINNSVRYDWASGLNVPTGITTHKGEVFVADFNTNYIEVYDEKGKHLRKFGSRRYLRQPWFLAVSSQDRLYVADSEGINVFTTAGEYKERFKISDEGNWLYRGIAIDRYDNVFVTARDGRARNAEETIAVFNSEHKCVKRFSADMDSMLYIRGLCINYDQNELAVVDGEWHHLKLFELYE